MEIERFLESKCTYAYFNPYYVHAKENFPDLASAAAGAVAAAIDQSPATIVYSLLFRLKKEIKYSQSGYIIPGGWAYQYE